VALRWAPLLVAATAPRPQALQRPPPPPPHRECDRPAAESLPRHQDCCLARRQGLQQQGALRRWTARRRRRRRRAKRLVQGSAQRARRAERLANARLSQWQLPVAPPPTCHTPRLPPPLTERGRFGSGACAARAARPPSCLQQWQAPRRALPARLRVLQPLRLACRRGCSGRRRAAATRRPPPRVPAASRWLQRLACWWQEQGQEPSVPAPSDSARCPANSEVAAAQVEEEKAEAARERRTR
jgi:hypothetical protein